jgi:hypothetical protein
MNLSSFKVLQPLRAILLLPPPPPPHDPPHLHYVPAFCFYDIDEQKKRSTKWKTGWKSGHLHFRIM